MTSMLEVRGAHIPGRLGSTDLTVAAGQMVALVGPNGSGKSSLLRACASITGSATEVRIDCEDLRDASPARRSRLLAYLPASRDLVWPMTVRDVIGLGLTTPAPKRVETLLATLELGPLAERRADRLSTGERARVLLARALVQQPTALLLDEPLSNLDPYWVLRILEILRGLTDNGTATIVALHDIDRITVFDRVLLMSHGELVADLPPAEMISSPLFAATFRLEHGAAGWCISQTAGPRS